MATWLHYGHTAGAQAAVARRRRPEGREAGGQGRPCASARALRLCGRPGRTVQACWRTALQKTCASILGATSSVGVAEMSLRFSGICEVSTAFHTCGVVRREP